MSAADAASLNWLSWLYTVGAWLVVVGVILEGAEICTRRVEQRKLSRFIGPLQHPLPEPGTPHWAHTVGDIGFVILVVGLIIEQVCHQRMEEITGRESKRLTVQLEAATKLAGDANERASSNELARVELEKQLFEMKQPRMISKEKRLDFIKFLENAPKGPVMIGSTNPNNETGIFMDIIASLLANAGYSIPSEINYECQPAIPHHLQIAILIEQKSASLDSQSRASDLGRAFIRIGYEADIIRFAPTHPCSLQLGTNDVMVFLTEKR